MALSQIQEAALCQGLEAAIRKVLAHLDPEHANKGARFRMYEIPDGARCFGDLIPYGDELWVGGNKNFDHRRTYSLVSAEKAIRLANNYVSEHHFASSQSRNPEMKQYGGAVILALSTKPGEHVLYLLALSGLPEDADEAVVLVAPLLSDGWTAFRSDQAYDSSIEAVLRRNPKNKLALAVVAEVDREQATA